MSTGRLHTLAVGSAGPRVAFLHGLFGQGRNWTQVAKALAGPEGEGARCLLVDLPDHGRSPWSEEFSYEGYADAVAATLADEAPGERWVVVGHSLGGKVAMVLTLTHPDLVGSLVVVDIAPKDYGDLDRFTGYIEQMRSLPLEELTSRADAEARFAEPDPGVKAFLLQNLRRHGTQWSWQANLELIHADAARGSDSRIAAFPDLGGRAWDGPVVWLAGSESGYVGDDDVTDMRALFPRTRLVRVNGAAHWVHTDAPEVVVETLRRVVRGLPAGQG
ncbi:alpha/beta fold hydrolase [Phycicoccus endophyticus]|uniref:alpha/beta fold hydrolase n=1 Tax=Phycicoccus endophyticus TaxID=1690220 RepID=UPI001408AB7B|nr:alpha/beta fold hydrolase [Phycicoccus endophyticus]NHI19206.1 alpha/beta fold hydrolase [Phycicoccus endophyticus]GGL40957.1 alpha/beta hydrolase [Phycicoccus endophyticus]